MGDRLFVGKPPPLQCKGLEEGVLEEHGGGQGGGVRCEVSER